jgi:hypothetical protein
MGAVIFVSGFPRCGSSMTMQMLHAAGIKCVGAFPDFEDERMGIAAPMAGRLSLLAEGGAIKRLEPSLVKVPPDCDFVTIWLDRDPVQQAKSQAGMIAALHGLAPFGRSAVRKIASSLQRDRQAALTAISHRPLLLTAFEDVLSDPAREARRIADFLGPVAGSKIFDQRAMAGAVLARTPAARGDMHIEAHLLRQVPS